MNRYITKNNRTHYQKKINMNNFPYIDILILAMIAVFIIYRLKSVLGKKTGNESDIVEKFTGRKSAFKESSPDRVIQKGKTTVKSPAKPLHNDPKIDSSLKKIKNLDLSFETDDFLKGAKNAFELILNKYSKNELGGIKSYVSNNLYKSFLEQANKRKNAKENLEISIIGIKKAEIISAILSKKTVAEIGVLFESEQVQVTKDIKGNNIDGDPNQILTIKELWIFSRDTKSASPNWVLEKIEENNI